MHTIITSHRHDRDGHDNELYLETSCLALQTEKERHETARWPRLELSIEDTITIKILEVNEADAPRKRYRSDAKVQENPFTEEEILKMQRETYLTLKKKFEGEMG